MEDYAADLPPTKTLELLNIAEAPRLSITTPISIQHTPTVVPDEGKDSKEQPKFLQKLLKFFHHSEKHVGFLREDKLPSQGSPEPEPPSSKLRAKFLNLFISPGKPHDSASSDNGSMISINEEELEVIKEKLPTKASSAELNFAKKYHFIGERIIGRGASGVVRMGVFNSDENHKIAVKEFRKRRRNETRHQYLVKLTAEYLIASKLHHPNIIETIDIVHDGKKWYEIMEFCPGGDLFTSIQNGSLGVDEIDSAFCQIVQGVSYLHSLGVAHRDLKPDNMLVDCQGYIRIGDFGVSDLILQEGSDVSRLSHGVCGSSPYIAPEEFTQGDYDARAVDVWAMAIIYFAMVFHTIPWQVAQLTDENYKKYVLGGPKSFEPFKRLSYGARNLLKRMLEPDPPKRATLHEIMQDEWFTSIQIVPIKICGNRKKKHEFHFVVD